MLDRASVRTFYEILAQPDPVPRGNGWVLGYGGANDFGFNSVVVESDGARRVVVVLTNAGGTRAEKLADRIDPLVFPQRRGQSARLGSRFAREAAVQRG